MHFETWEEKILELHQQNLDELLRNELNHEEPPWRTPVTKGWWDRMKEERIRWALWWFRWRFRRDGRGNFDSGKEKLETLRTERLFIMNNLRGKELLDHDEIRIRIALYLSSSNSIDDKQWILHTTYSSWKRIDKWHIANSRRSSRTTGRIGKNEWIKMIIKEKNLKEPP